jgi:hypothetical protein
MRGAGGNNKRDFWSGVADISPFISTWMGLIEAHTDSKDGRVVKDLGGRKHQESIGLMEM